MLVFESGYYTAAITDTSWSSPQEGYRACDGLKTLQQIFTVVRLASNLRDNWSRTRKMKSVLVGAVRDDYIELIIVYGHI